MWCMEHSSSCCAEMNIHIELRRVSQRISIVSFKEVKPLVLYSVEHGIAMEPMEGKCASYRVDLGYTELFCIPEVHQCSSRFVQCSWGLYVVPSRK